MVVAPDHSAIAKVALNKLRRLKSKSLDRVQLVLKYGVREHKAGTVLPLEGDLNCFLENDAVIAVSVVQQPAAAQQGESSAQAESSFEVDAQQALTTWLDTFEKSTGGHKVLHDPGMEYGSEASWWGSKKGRPHPHEGVDVVLSDTAVLRGMRLRPIESGVVIAIHDDFLGKTVVVQRSNSNRQFWLYAHIEPSNDIQVGTSLNESSDLGCVALSSTKCPSHLHISLAQISQGIEPSEAKVFWSGVTWSRIHEHDDALEFLPIQLNSRSDLPPSAPPSPPPAPAAPPPLLSAEAATRQIRAPFTLKA